MHLKPSVKAGRSRAGKLHAVDPSHLAETSLINALASSVAPSYEFHISLTVRLILPILSKVNKLE